MSGAVYIRDADDRVLSAVTGFLARLKAPSRIMVAISGGSDSAGLLLALHEALGGGHSLCAATVDHALRPESAAEAEAVSRLCATLAIDHMTLRWGEAKPHSGISAAARDARYRLLNRAAQQMGADLIVTAHTAGDQAETALMRAARVADGNGPGLAGMAEAVLYNDEIWVARPFLVVERQDIRAFLSRRGHGWIDDPSNADPHYERVRVRAALAQGACAPDTAAAAAQRKALAVSAAQWLSAHATLHGAALLHLPVQALDADKSILRFALSGLVAFMGGRGNGPAGAAMERLLALGAEGRPQRMTLGRVFVALRRDGLYLLREERDLPDLCLAAGEEQVWDGRFRIRNESGCGIAIHAAGGMETPLNVALFGAVPASLARRAAAGLPRAILPAAQGQGAVLQPVIAPYGQFLPLFDLPFANALARLAGLDPFTEPCFFH